MVKTYGLSLLELLIACVIMVIIAIPLVDILNNTFMVEYHNRVSAENKEYRSSALQLIASNIKAASYIYSADVTIPTEKGSATVSLENNGIALLIPVVDSDGTLVRSSGQTEFDAYAYALVPESSYYSGNNSSDMALVASHTTFYCASTNMNPYKPSVTCNTSWDNATTNVIFKGAKPGIMNGFTSSFSLENAETVKNDVTIAFGVFDGTIYYASGTGKIIPDNNVQALKVISRNISY